ncbi:MAG: methyltransferase domain-containing protein [Lachnospiraceae bacterium]|nr:methyltransferase domain-containing protein [Lachnospiraceae bacterium]
MINFKLAELRKKNNLTQQELGEALGVSYQTISKWENGVVSPDITMLPRISTWFGVSVDALLGLVPLDETYQPANSGTAEYWSNRIDYLKRTRKIMWNEDYMEFLVRSVWKLEKPVTILDCGCGYGSLGLMLLPILPKGSRYVGIDFNENMIAEAKRIYGGLAYDAEFILADIASWRPRETYDMVVSQAVLRHVNDGKFFLDRMIGFVGEGGLVVSMECNREFEAAGLYLEGMDYGDLCEHSGLKKLWTTELRNQNRDYSIAMKIPHYMKQAGLHDIGCRMNDRVTFLEPQQEEYQEILSGMIRADHWDDEKTKIQQQDDIAYFMNHGMSYREAEEYCRKENGIVRYLKENRGNVALTRVNGVMISYGWK